MLHSLLTLFMLQSLLTLFMLYSLLTLFMLHSLLTLFMLYSLLTLFMLNSLLTTPRVCVSVPLTFVGAFFGFRKPKLTHPTQTNQVSHFET